MASSFITSLLSLATNLLPSITVSAQAPSSSLSNSSNSQKERARAVADDLKSLMRTLEWIKATLYDAEEREIIDHSVKLWLKELKKVAYDAEDVLSEYRYEVTRVQVKERKGSEASSSHKRKQMEYIVRIPDGMVDRLNKIKSQFDEIAKDRKALQLRKSDGVRRPNNNILRPPTGHMVDEESIFGREEEIENVIRFLLSEKEKSFSVISIVGKGGLGKTTIAQCIYRDGRVLQCFELLGWVCVSEEFDVRRLMKATIESVSKTNCGVSELSPLQEVLAETVKGKIMLLVLDDVWNENKSLWEVFRVPFKGAKMVRILVTARNDKVAKAMQTTTIFRPSNLPESSCWQLFQHYAFTGTCDTMPTNLVDMGRKIMRKCGGLPLAVKSIASLLRYETDDESWIEILENDIWESKSSNDIFPALHISYAHLPTHLKSCFLLCSMYPKDYEINKGNMIELWISNGYIKSRGKKEMTEIGVEYYEELKERSFLDDFSESEYKYCKLHDIIHDLARLISDNEHYSVEINQPLDIQKEDVMRKACHLYVGGFAGYVPQNLKGFRTLFMDLRACIGDLEHKHCIHNTKAMDLNSNLSEYYTECSRAIHICILAKLKFEALRVLILNWHDLTIIPDSISELKHLAYLRITSSRLEMLPKSIGLLYNLQTLILDCYGLESLPESIGDLLNLLFLKIQSANLRNLPQSLGSLNNLLRLLIRRDNLEDNLEDHLDDDLEDIFLDYDPHGFVNFRAIKTMKAWLKVRTVGWLENMTDLEGNLSIYGVSNLKDAQRANMRNKCKLETLDLSWDPDSYPSDETEEPDLLLSLKLEACVDEVDGANDAAFSWLESLQPHPNLKILRVRCYPSVEVPAWMSDPCSLQSIQGVLLEECYNILSVPFSNLHTLKHLRIDACDSIRVLQLEQLSSQLEELNITRCANLELITGLGNLDMLGTLEIGFCDVLNLITMGGLQLVESTEPIGDSSKENPRIGQQSISSLASLQIEHCRLLCVMPEGLILSGSCRVYVHGCGCSDIERN